MAKRFGKAIFILQALTLIVLMRVCFTSSLPENICDSQEAALDRNVVSDSDMVDYIELRKGLA